MRLLRVAVYAAHYVRSALTVCCKLLFHKGRLMHHAARCA